MIKHFVFIFISCFGFSQNRMRVLDAKTTEPISYANIWIDNKIYTTVDSLGYFNSDNKNYQLYKISAIGYDDKLVNTLDNNILLEPKIITLKEIIIYNPNFLNVKKIGKATKKGNTIGVNFDAEIHQFIKYIPNNSKNEKLLFINSVSFYTNTTSKNRKINIIIYSVSENGEPNEIINEENIICNLKKGNTLNKIDLKKLKINLPKEGVFIGVQHLLIEDNKYYPSKNNNNKSFCYEPFLYITEYPENYDSWFMEKDTWVKSKYYSLNLEVEISD